MDNTKSPSLLTSNGDGEEISGHGKRNDILVWQHASIQGHLDKRIATTDNHKTSATYSNSQKQIGRGSLSSAQIGRVNLSLKCGTQSHNNCRLEILLIYRGIELGVFCVKFYIYGQHKEPAVHEW